jgi:hypothetical protein
MLGTADIVTVRAVKTDDDLFDTAGRLLKANGQLMLFRPAHSASADPLGFTHVRTFPLTDTPPSFLCVYRRTFHVEH